MGAFRHAIRRAIAASRARRDPRADVERRPCRPVASRWTICTTIEAAAIWDVTCVFADARMPMGTFLRSVSSGSDAIGPAWARKNASVEHGNVAWYVASWARTVRIAADPIPAACAALPVRAPLVGSEVGVELRWKTRLDGGATPPPPQESFWVPRAWPQRATSIVTARLRLSGLGWLRRCTVPTT